MNTVNNNQAPAAYQLLVTKCGKWVECSKADFDCVQATPGMWPDIKVRALYVEQSQVQSGGIHPNWKLAPMEQADMGIPISHPQPERQPLTDKRIDELLVESALVPVVPLYKTLARAVEREHRIGQAAAAPQPAVKESLTDEKRKGVLLPEEFYEWWAMRPSLTRLQAWLVWKDENKQTKAAAADAQEQCRTALAAIEKLNAELGRVSEQRDVLLAALQEMLEMSEEPPEKNCSCHPHLPCNDCMDHSGLRYAFKQARAAIASVEGGAV